LAASGGDHHLLVTWDFYSRVASFYGQVSFTLVWKIHQVGLCLNFGEFVLASLLQLWQLSERKPRKNMLQEALTYFLTCISHPMNFFTLFLFQVSKKAY
jgi:hypothetical protein